MIPICTVYSTAAYFLNDYPWFILYAMCLENRFTNNEWGKTEYKDVWIIIAPQNQENYLKKN